MTYVMPNVDCVGWVVVTEVTDSSGRVAIQHSPIYRTRAKADAVAKAGMRKLHAWERSIVRRVEACCTAFPLADVLAGEAQRWGDYLESVSAAREVRRAA